MILMLHLQSKRSEMSTFRRHCRFALMRVGLFALALISARTGLAEDARWSKEKAWNWYNKVSPIVGCNYLPRTAVNMTEMWQRESFDPTVIDQELGWARKVGFNSVRVFLPYVVWKDDPKGLKKRIDRFLEIANRHQIRTMLLLFCDCAFAGKEPYLGRQNAPVPGVHNSGWVPSPGLTLVTDRNVWPDLEKYVKDIVGTFRQDDRVLIWDLYNEPGNSNMELKSLPLVEATFAWARQVAPQQPLTVGAWSNRTDGMPERLVELSDVVSFHAYNRPADMKKKVAHFTSLGRPTICTECLIRPAGRFEDFLPLFAQHKVSWYNWGLVAGRTQTYMPWGSKKGTPVPDVWQHDVLHANGQPYDPKEIELIRNFSKSWKK